MKKLLKKLNPMNLIEKWIIKRFAKKIINSLPDLKEKGIKIVEKETEKLLEKIQVVIIKFVEEHKN